jgi:hypothetical protein
VRLLLARDLAGLFAWSAGALLVPALAFALGIWTESSRPFEGLYTALWYVGPLNRVRGFDFTGAGNGTQTGAFAGAYLAVTAALLFAALLGRTRQVR